MDVVYILSLKSIVIEVLRKELDVNKLDADKYLDIILNMHQWFINTEHPEFTKMRKLKEKDGVRYKNHFNKWFQEEIKDPESVGQGKFSYTNLQQYTAHIFIA